MTIINHANSEAEFRRYSKYFLTISEYLYWRAVMLSNVEFELSEFATRRSVDIFADLPMWARILLEFTNV